MRGGFSAPGDYIYFKSQVPLHKIPVSFFPIFFFLIFFFPHSWSRFAYLTLFLSTQFEVSFFYFDGHCFSYVIVWWGLEAIIFFGIAIFFWYFICICLYSLSLFCFLSQFYWLFEAVVFRVDFTFVFFNSWKLDRLIFF